MDKQLAIKMRDALKGGKNLPLRIIFMDGQFIADESNAFCYTKWDDDNGIFYYWRLLNPNDHVYGGTNILGAVDVVAAPYDYIGMMRAVTPLEMMDDQFGTIEAAGASMSEQFKKTIKYTFKEAMDNDRVELNPKQINAIHGTKVINEKDNYYGGEFTEPFKETRPKAQYNKWIDEKLAAEAGETETPSEEDGKPDETPLDGGSEG